MVECRATAFGSEIDEGAEADDAEPGDRAATVRAYGF